MAARLGRARGAVPEAVRRGAPARDLRGGPLPDAVPRAHAPPGLGVGGRQRRPLAAGSPGGATDPGTPVQPLELASGLSLLGGGEPSVRQEQPPDVPFRPAALRDFGDVAQNVAPQRAERAGNPDAHARGYGACPPRCRPAGRPGRRSVGDLLDLGMGPPGRGRLAGPRARGIEARLSSLHRPRLPLSQLPGN